jgi:hypothetical protein
MAYSDILGNLPESPVGRDFDMSRPVETFVPIGRAIVLQPVAFFTSMPRVGGYPNPLAFALICAGISGILTGLFRLGGAGISGFIVAIVIALVGTAIGMFLISYVSNFLVNNIIGAGRGNYETTFRVVAYASVTSIVSWIPVIGSLAGLYSLYLATVGIREVYQTTTGKALGVVLISAAILVVVYIIVAFVLVAVIVSSSLLSGALGG